MAATANPAPKAKLIFTAKQFRKDLDEVLQRMKGLCDEISGALLHGFVEDSKAVVPNLVLSIRHVEDAIMRQGMFLKAVGNPNHYPMSYDPSSTEVEPTADALKMRVVSVIGTAPPCKQSPARLPFRAPRGLLVSKENM